ncbi:hypothetical protein GEMRC1_002592 [Eukaryota sp. GEM-RC1]
MAFRSVVTLLLCSIFTLIHPFYFFWSSLLATQCYDYLLLFNVSLPPYLILFSIMSFFVFFRYCIFVIRFRFLMGFYPPLRSSYRHFTVSHIPALFNLPLVILSFVKDLSDSFIFISGVTTLIVAPLVFLLLNRYHSQYQMKSTLKIPILLSLLSVFVLLTLLRNESVISALDQLSVISLLPSCWWIELCRELVVFVDTSIFESFSFPFLFLHETWEERVSKIDEN